VTSQTRVAADLRRRKNTAFSPTVTELPWQNRTTNEINEHEERIPTTSGGAVTQTTEAAMQVERADLLWRRLSAYLRMGLLPQRQTLEQRAALALAKAALDTYLGYYYAPGSRQ
jgi:hypothetical protein